MLWPWVYRLIGALLSFVGAALAAFVVRVFGDEAHRLSQLFGDGFVVLGALLAVLLLVSGVVMLASALRDGPAQRA